MKMGIDLTFDFRRDTPLNKDPDIHSNTLRLYQSIFLNKKLPNGEIFNLKIADRKTDYLVWKDFRFASDFIIVSFAYNTKLILKVKKVMGEHNYYLFRRKYLEESYTLAGEMIFPKHKYSINQNKGMNKYVVDRFDITLDYIRKYYLGIESPLYNCFLRDKDFFDLFIDFKGFVDFFFFQDLVSNNYSSINYFYQLKKTN